MIELDGKAPVVVKPVNLKMSYPNYTLFVKALTANEFLALGEKFVAGEKDKNRARDIEAMICDAEGNRVIKPGEGGKFLDGLLAVDLQRLEKVVGELNSMTDAAIEVETKN